MADERIVPLPEGGAVLIDQIGAVAIETQPAGEEAVVIDLGGTLNKTDERWKGKFLASPGQAGELVATLVYAVYNASDRAREIFGEEMTREQERLLAIQQEHG